jgi:hypothetical protein
MALSSHKCARSTHHQHACEGVEGDGPKRKTITGHRTGCIECERRRKQTRDRVARRDPAFGVESKRVRDFQDMTDEELERYVNGDKDLAS